MAKNFQELLAGMSSTAKAASAAEHQRLAKEIAMLQFRKARELTHAKIAEEVHLGQDVIVKLNNSPYEEYGVMKGKVANISQVTNQQQTEQTGQNKVDVFLVTVSLPQGLKTNFGSALVS